MKDGEEQWILKSEEQEHLDKLCRPGIPFSTPSLPVFKEEETLSSSPSEESWAIEGESKELELIEIYRLCPGLES
ncbi:uncharacterized protein N7446_002224 [Penicillium canescens]|uniref:Uncharacterized protein n=1 Tax=Penicillium canescens TaxID=5083 RepID=A0AAD6IEU2_PENCN|nr:uncharacterized protein N7446_002224 [Penicillium canescens]KAJ6044028.1 hypothetical protein N7460_005383 [Penicillium canescens]KAJ6055500.1 hypothetical protein N7444_004598 [Penicillium canescens]KAJ6074447.1 hypothetical protein N7446_002224 [Penicillium canescens]